MDERMLLGQLRSVELPGSIEIDSIEKDFGQLKADAFREGREWGGCLVFHEGRLDLVDPAPGWKTEVSPKRDLTGDPNYVGFAHVHLPDDATLQPYLGFSERDYRGTVADGDRLALVTNGPEVFALVRSRDMTVPRQEIAGSEFSDWEKMYDRAAALSREEMRRSGKGRASIAFNRALLDVNLYLCERLGFAFYRGDWGRPLRQVFRP